MSDRLHSDRPTAPLRVQLPDGTVRTFDRPFHIGREQSCELRVDDQRVSRRHALVTVDQGQWVVRDLRSANGLFASGARVESVAVGAGVAVRLGADGPTLSFAPAVPRASAVSSPTEAFKAPAPPAPPPPPSPAVPPRPASLPTTPARGAGPQATGSATPRGDEGKLLEHVADRYFSEGSGDEPVGERTMMIRRAFQQVQKQQRRRYRGMIAAAVVLAVIAGGYALYTYRQLSRQQQIAGDLFYQMKSIDMSIAQVEQRLAQTGSSQDRSEIARYMEQRRQLEKNYEQFVANIYDRRLTEKERLILKVTRRFGEFELAAPPDYMKEVQRYIQRWQSTGRFVRAAKLAQDLGYPKRIADEFIAQDLPPQFFYLAMQESDFDAFRSGPPTRFGIAKGMWQFIPETGSRYGLSIGPLQGQPRPDPADDRLKWDKATVAAAKYIKDIYSTDAQASGLLVMASYNWGERRVIDLIRTLPPNPRERNFWKLLERYRGRLPLETYDYVFYIVSASVIGENPRLFGFQIDSPLGFLPQ
ncbi:MAG: FHA domain-containing protein [Acidobacteria bacterium]|nr:FHA domain-containing protein [Acidobacteriota bacterium]